jgi:Tetratricopeptide repeat
MVGSSLDRELSYSDLTDSLSRYRALGDQFSVANRLNDLARHDVESDKLEEASAHLGEALTICRELSAPTFYVVVSENLGLVASLQGRLPEALRAGIDSLNIHEELHQPRYCHYDLILAATCMTDTFETAHAAGRLLTAAQAIEFARQQLEATIADNAPS